MAGLTSAEPLTHERRPPRTGEVRFWAEQAAYQLPMITAMGFMVAVAHDSGAAGAPGLMLLVAVGLVFIAIAHAPHARTHASAREHILDLWTMAAIILLPLFASSSPPRVAREGMRMGPASIDGAILLPVILAGWTVARVALGWRETKRRRHADGVCTAPGELRREGIGRMITGVCCAASLVIMLLM